MRIDQLATGAADAAALVSSTGQALSYAELIRWVVRTSDALAREGVAPGDCVAVCAQAPTEFLICALGVWHSGAVLLPLDPRAGPAWHLRMAGRGHARLCVTGVGRDGTLAMAPLPIPAPPGLFEPDLGLLMFTSGSSGEPKGALLTCEGILANVDAILEYLPVRAAPRSGIVLPLSYGYALVGQSLTTLRAGATAVLLCDLPFPPQQLEAMERLSVTDLSSVPTSLKLLARCVQESGRPPPPLAYVASAGAPLGSDTREALRAAFPRARLFNQYGMTEASPRVAAISDEAPEFLQGAAGFPLRGIKVYAADAEGGALPPGQDGEIWVEGPSVMRRYLDAPEATLQVRPRPSVLRTGDFGRVEANGCLFVRGRMDGVVKCGGERVSADEVTFALKALVSHAEVAVIAVPDPSLGARLVACFEGASTDLVELRRAARDLPPAKRPSRFVAIAALPRTPNGKLDLAALRALAGADQEKAP